MKRLGYMSPSSVTVLHGLPAAVRIWTHFMPSLMCLQALHTMAVLAWTTRKGELWRTSCALLCLLLQGTRSFLLLQTFNNAAIKIQRLGFKIFPHKTKAQPWELTQSGTCLASMRTWAQYQSACVKKPGVITLALNPSAGEVKTGGSRWSSSQQV